MSVLPWIVAIPLWPVLVAGSPAPGEAELLAAPFFYELNADRLGDAVVVAAVPASGPGRDKQRVVLRWLDLGTLTVQEDAFETRNAVASEKSPTSVALLGTVVTGDRTATLLWDIDGERVLVTKSLGGPVNASRLPKELGPSELAVTAVRRGLPGRLLLLGSESDVPVVVEIGRRGELLRKQKIAVTGNGSALDAYVLASGDVAIAGASGVSTVRPSAEAIWLALWTQDQQVQGLRELPGQRPSLVPLPSGLASALLYQLEGQTRLTFPTNGQQFGGEPGGVVIPEGRGCAAAAIGKDAVVVTCNKGSDSRLAFASPRGIEREIVIRDTNRLRPVIAFAREGMLFEIAVVLETSGKSEKLTWRWAPVQR